MPAGEVARSKPAPSFGLSGAAGAWFSPRVTGTLINTVAILLGGFLGMKASRQLSVAAQTRIKLALAAFTIYAGVSMIWRGTGGSFGMVVKQVGIACLALVLGNGLGMLLRLQDGLNRLGQYAKERLAGGGAEGSNRFSEGFVTCSLLFCVGPMAILGPLEDGLHGDFKILAVKSAMDGLAAMGFAASFGAGVMLSALPVLAYQGTISLAAHALAQHVNDPVLLDSIRVVGGMVVMCITVVILDLRKVPLANYLPSLAVAPVLTHWWR